MNKSGSEFYLPLAPRYHVAASIFPAVGPLVEPVMPSPE